MSARAEVWSCGGGTQSVAIAALIIQGRLPRPDVSVIVDTGYEKRTTWDYFDAVLAPALAASGITLHRVHRADWCAPWCAPVGGLVATSGHVMIPAFSDITGDTSKLKNLCTGAWKVEVCDRWLSATYGLTPSKRRKWLGLSVDEPRRWIRKLDDPSIFLPLVKGVPMKRDGCVRLIREMGWPEAPRSNCWMCPNQSAAEWRDLHNNHPEEFAKAVEIEIQLRDTDPFLYLHPSCAPLGQVDWSAPITAHERACNSGECFT